MTKDQEIARLRDLLTWVTDHARCLETRKFVAKGLRDIDVLKETTHEQSQSDRA